MADPKDLDEYNRLTVANQRIDGFGLETAQHLPCPFCAAPDFNKVRVVSAQEDMSKDVTCKECGRSSKLVFTRNASGISFELVQTGGPPPADWFPFSVRRAS